MRNRTRNLFAGICSFVLIGGAAIAGDPATVDLSELKMLDVPGARHVLSANDVRGTAFVFVSTECPISRQYIPELNRLAKTAADGKVAFYGVISDSAGTRADAVKFVDEFHVAFPILFDSSRELAALFGPGHLPEAFVVDSRGTVSYRGRIDDVYADIDKRRTEPAHRDLLDAITAVARWQTSRRTSDRGRGLPVRVVESHMAAEAKVTYARDIAPILFAHCAECHRPGEVAPFSLLTYKTRRSGRKDCARHRTAVDAALAGRRALRAVSRRTAADRATRSRWSRRGPTRVPRRQFRPICLLNQSFRAAGGSARPTSLCRFPCVTAFRPTVPTSFSIS